MKNSLFLSVLMLLLVNGVVYFALLRKNENVLSVAFLDVGQGDAILIEAPNGNQVLVDAGPDGSIIRELGSEMPFYDRSIDVLLASHADADHIGGFPDVLSRFEVEYIVEGGSVSETPLYEAFMEEVKKEDGAKHAILSRGDVVHLGGGAYLHILFPDRQASEWEDNTASILMKLVYGKTSFLLTGDAPKSVEEYLVSLDQEYLDSDVLKIGHHGSRTSTSEAFLSFVTPRYSVISAGEDNRYGHPHEEVVQTLLASESEILCTCEVGTVVFESNGEKIKLVD